VYSSLIHVIHAGQKYTISSPSGRGMSVDYKSVLDWTLIRRGFQQNISKLLTVILK